MNSDELDATPKQVADKSLEELDAEIEAEIAAVLEMVEGIPEQEISPALLTDPRFEPALDNLQQSIDAYHQKGHEALIDLLMSMLQVIL